MPSPFRRALTIAAAMLVTAAAAQAQPPSQPRSPRIRPETKEARALLDELIARSPTAQRLADRLEESDVIVYVRYRWFATDTIDGHIGLMSSDPHHRYLIIELACLRTGRSNSLRSATNCVTPWRSPTRRGSPIRRRFRRSIDASANL